MAKIFTKGFMLRVAAFAGLGISLFLKVNGETLESILVLALAIFIGYIGFVKEKD